MKIFNGIKQKLIKRNTKSDNDLPWFINEPKIAVYRKDKGELENIDTLIFGDEIGIRKDKSDVEYCAIVYKKSGKLLEGVVKKSAEESGWKTQSRMLELYFIDVGQGDSILIHTPYDEKLVIDGGPDNTMHKFLQSRYKDSRYNDSQIDLDVVMMTHGDKDHAAGLVPLFKDNNIHTKAFLHNGIAKFQKRTKSGNGEEETSPEKTQKDTSIGRIKIEGKNEKLVETFDQIDDIKFNQRLGEEFARLIKAIKEYRETNSVTIRRIDNTEKIREELRTVSPFSNWKDDFSITILGPINIGSERPEFHYIGGDDKTINGNSISLLIKYHHCRILLCGDMNKEFEQKFMEFYNDENKYQAHIFKANHHGSQYFCNEFLKKVSPSISVVSAGYHRKYGHPRAILLGCLGRYSFNSSDNNDKPILFITKISGTYKKISIEYILDRTKSLMNTLKNAFKRELNNFLNFFDSKERGSKKFFSDLLSNVYEKSNDGTIYVRTDGTTIVAGRIIAITDSIKTEWELYTFTVEGNRLIKHKDDYDCD